MIPFNPVCACGHRLREHEGFRSLSPFMLRPCPVEGCGCKDFREDDGNDYEEGRAAA